MVSSDNEKSEKIRVSPRPTKSMGSADDLVSVTIKKTDPDQKAGIKLAQKQGGLYVTGILENGFFHGSEIEADDKILSLNGKRLQPGENIKDFMSNISTLGDKVTIVVKKANMQPSRTARSMSPTKRRKKLVKKLQARQADGSYDGGINPTLKRYEEATSDGENEEYDQHRIRAQKLLPKQGAGVLFKKLGDMLFVSGIALDSVFRDTVLALGDRVVSVNDVNFMSYADGPYATTLLKRGNDEVSLVVEKGWKEFNKEKDVDEHHDKPSRDSLVVNGDDSKDKAIMSNSRSDSGLASSRHKSQESNGLRFLEHEGDFLCITIKKKSEKHAGIKVKEVQGIFILTKVPSYEKRIPLGSHVLAINGSSSFSTAEEAKELIGGTKDRVVLIINYEQPVLENCPCCGKWITTNGEHYEEK
jgi:PDZ domain-containing secreted protein